MAESPAPLRPWHRDAFARVPVTVTLLAVVAAIYVLEEVWGGSQSTATLARMGAIVTGVPVPMPMAAPRVLAYGALHIGPVHLFVNAFALWNLGRALEPLLGRALYVVLFFGSVLAGGIGIVAFAGVGVTAGASGGLFGLLGAVAVLLAVRYRTSTHPYERTEIRNQLAQLILPNVLISLIPGVSLAGHAGGFAYGLAFMAALRLVGGERPTPERRRAVLKVATTAASVLVIAFVVSIASIWTVTRPWVPMGGTDELVPP